jgi:hypothetical protein
MTSEQLSDLFTEARSNFTMLRADIPRGDCRVCKVKNVPLAQHWNDVGDLLECEACWIESWICFQLAEDEA